jgi:hypothetical protein
LNINLDALRRGGAMTSRGIFAIGCALAFASMLLFAGCYSDPPGASAHACAACLPCESCVEGTDGPICAAESHASQTCVETIIHWLDSCGADEGVDEACSGNTTCANSTDGTAACVCTNHWGGENCDECPAHWDPAQDCNACLNHWVDEGNDCGTCPANWDPAHGCNLCLNHWVDEGNDCGTCPANFDTDQDCDACRTHWEGASCLTCPGNWDSDQDCDACRNHWEGADCETCPDGWDMDQDCAACRNHWEGADCETCPGNWDSVQDCGECRGHWDSSSGCTACLTHWVDESNDCGTCPGNWDSSQNCAVCENQWTDESNDCGTCPGNWDASSDCAACAGHWDEATDCAACANQWIDESNDCGTCPGNWAASSDCSVCLGNWDEASDCIECENQWVDEGNDCGTCPDGWAGLDCDTCVRYVDGSMVSSGDGLTWTTAFKTIQSAIDAAATAAAGLGSGARCDVWVAGNRVYYIYQTAAANTVKLKPQVDVYGGFAGGEADRRERDWNANPTLLSGLNAAGGSNVVFHVVNGADNATLDGFVVEYGDSTGANVPYDANYYYSSNSGGGMVNLDASPTIRNCLFGGNYSENGGAIANWRSNPTIQNCVFEGNAAQNGGAVFDNRSSPVYENCFFYENDGLYGTAMRADYTSYASVTNCTIVGIASSTAFVISTYSGHPQFSNCILWDGDSNVISVGSFSTVIVQWSDVRGSWTGTGNIASDPLFADSDSGKLLSTSPCIDAADGTAAPATDFDGNPRVDDTDVANTGSGPPWADMGAYEYQP